MLTVLVTGGCSPAARRIAAALRQGGASVRLTDRPAAAARADAGEGLVPCGLDDGPETLALLDAVDYIVHLEPALALPAHDGAGGWLDICTRCTYNLLYAAAEASGVVGCLCMSTTALYADYGPSVMPEPEWQPRPTCEPDQLGPHLAEWIARQYAATGALQVRPTHTRRTSASPAAA